VCVDEKLIINSIKKNFPGAHSSVIHTVGAYCNTALQGTKP